MTMNGAMRWQGWKRWWRPGVATTLATLACLPTAEAADRATDPDPVARQIEQRALGRSPKTAPSLATTLSAPAAGIAAAPVFRLRNVSIVGATAIPEAELVSTLVDYPGRTVGLSGDMENCPLGDARNCPLFG